MTYCPNTRSVYLLTMLVFGMFSFVSVEHCMAGQRRIRLNNLVTELFTIKSPITETKSNHKFRTYRDGWVYIESTVLLPSGGSVRITVDDDDANAPIIEHRIPKDPIKQTMRYMLKGKHTLKVYVDGDATIDKLVVRSIPEIIYAEVGYWSPIVLSPHAPYTWEYLTNIGMTDNINVVLERHPDPAMDVRQWRSQGKRVFINQNIGAHLDSAKPLDADSVYNYWSGPSGLGYPNRDGLMCSELDGYGTQSTPKKQAEYAAMIGALKKLSQDPILKNKVIYPYCNVMYDSEPSRQFIKKIAEVGYKFTEDRYLGEPPAGTKDVAKYIHSELGYVMRMYSQKMPGFQIHMIMNIGNMSAPPESLNTNPQIDYKVFLDMQLNSIANKPEFDNLYGFMFYHSSYVDEETLRWSTKLIRHYWIEGNKTMLSTDPIHLTHIKNADFTEGTKKWTLDAASKGSMEVKTEKGFNLLQGRYPKPKGDSSFVWMKRSDEKPNRLSQEIRGLQPGRLYSLKMYVADYQHFQKGTDQKQKHTFSIKVGENVTVRPYKELFTSSRIGRRFEKFNKKNGLWITYCHYVFRATEKNAMLSISDWISDNKPGGPIGQELMLNFIEVQPYLEDNWNEPLEN